MRSDERMNAARPLLTASLVAAVSIGHAIGHVTGRCRRVSRWPPECRLHHGRCIAAFRQGLPIRSVRTPITTGLPRVSGVRERLRAHLPVRSVPRGDADETQSVAERRPITGTTFLGAGGIRRSAADGGSPHGGVGKVWGRGPPTRMPAATFGLPPVAGGSKRGGESPRFAGLRRQKKRVERFIGTWPSVNGPTYVK